eukprot:s750_g15.t1
MHGECCLSDNEDVEGPHAAQARPGRDCTPPQVGVPAATRRRRAAQRVPAGQTTEQPKLRAQQPGVAPAPLRPAARRASGAPGGCFGAKTTADFDTDNDQAAATGTHELRVSLMTLASRGSVDSSARVHVSSRLSLTSPGDGADDGGIYGLLRAMPKGKSVRDDFNAAVVGHRHIDVHVCQADITGDTRTGFLADPRSSAFKREGPGGEHSGSCAGSPVIAEWVKA